MDFEKKLDIIQDVLGDHKRAGKNEYLFFCPECQYGVKLSINFNKNTFKCWYCLWAGTLNKLVKKLGNETQKINWFGLIEEQDFYDYDQLVTAIKTGTTKREEVVTNNVKVSEEFPVDDYWNLYDCKDYTSAQPPLKYLDERGISWTDIRKYQMGYCLFGRYKHRIVIPSYDRYGSLNYFIARTYDKNQEYRYFNSKASKDIVFNEFRIDWNKPVVIVEGVFDAIKVENAIPILGTELNENGYLMNQLLKYKPKIFLSLDPDARKRQHYISRKLSTYGLEVISVEYRGQKDFGDMNSAEIEKVLKESDNNNFTDYDLLKGKILGA